MTERLAGSNLDGSAKIRPARTKEMTATEIAELKKLLNASFQGVNRGVRK
jgi:hypothetical protein